MSVLVKRLRDMEFPGGEYDPNWDTAHDIVSEAADRIEKLERELRNERNNRREEGFKQVKELEQQLAAEKELADRLAEDLTHLTQFHTSARYQGTLAAYRKARGM